MATTQAKAWTYTTTIGGLIPNLKLTDYTVPPLTKDNILLEILNISLNPGDLKFPDTPILSRFITKPASPAFDFCGRIRALPAGFANDSRQLQVGQVVFGMHRDIKTLGTAKTVMVVHKDSVYPLPENFPVEHGSTLGIGAMTAYQAIAPYAKPGNKVLVNGGSGGVGIFCIQVAKALDMYVIATCSEAGAKLCKDLGADEILDYKAASFHEDLCRTQVNLVVDNVGYDTGFHRRSVKFLKPDGQFVLVGLMAESWAGIQSMLLSCFLPAWLGGVRRKWRGVFTSSTVGDYGDVARLTREKGLRVVVDSVFGFGDVPRAYEKLKSGRVKGKVVVDVIGSGS